MKQLISSKVNRIDSSQIQKAYKLSSILKNPIDLSIGVPFGNTPQSVKNAAIKAVKNNLTRYTPPQGIDELIVGLFKELKTKDKLLIKNKGCIVVTPGVTVGLLLVFLALFEKDDEIIIFDPYFPIYLQLCNILGIKYRLVSTYPDFQIDIQKLMTAITSKTKAILINSPNNPTGAIYENEVLTKIAEIAEKHNLILISDEIYKDFAYSKTQISIGSIYENTVTLNGFSKSFAMSGFRVGYIAGPEEIANGIKKIAPYIYFSNPSISQHAALKALETDNSSIIKEHKKRHDLAIKLLSPKFKINGGEGAFYLFLQAPNGKGDEFIELAAKKNLILLPGSLFSQKKTHFRLSYATSLENLKRGIEIINSLVKL